MNLKNIFIGICLLIYSSLSLAVQDSKVVNIGGKYITIVSPYGFYIENDKDIADLFKDILPKDKVNIQALILPEKYDENDSRVIAVVSIIEIEKKNMSEKLFNILSRLLVEQQYTFLNKIKDSIDKLDETIRKNLKDKYDVEIYGSIDEATSLGVFINKKNAVGVTTIMEGRWVFEGEVDDVPMIGTMTYLNLKNRLVYAVVYKDYNDSKDVLWVKSKTKELVDLLLEVNN